MAQDDLARGMARADLCRFLAACYYEPGPEFAEEKLFESMQAAASRVHPDFAAGAPRRLAHSAKSFDVRRSKAVSEPTPSAASACAPFDSAINREICAIRVHMSNLG